uniref:Activin_recp domain-containing protein n=1 Tax=Panagrellus redivivus TaxID=6233 RepID=A0A7E4W9E2_PANRE
MISQKWYLYAFSLLNLFIIACNALAPAIPHSAKKMCYKCSGNHDCTHGFCYGDYCVKSTSGNFYVSKGCENKSSNVYARSVAERSDITTESGNNDVGCVDTEVFGVSNVVCYCKDNDFCNIGRSLSPSGFLITFSMISSLIMLRFS